MKIKSKTMQIKILLTVFAITIGVLSSLLLTCTNQINTINTVFANDEITHNITERIESWNVIFVDAEVNGLRYELLNDNQKTVSVYTCSASGEVVIPHKINYNSQIYTVVEIGDESFTENINVTSVFVPQTVRTIDYTAFYGCNNLEIKFESIEPASFDGWAVLGDPSNASSLVKKILVPKIAEDDYKTAWSDYVSIIEGYEEEIENTGIVIDIILPTISIIILTSLLIVYYKKFANKNSDIQ